jgi:hypothetical protein
VPSRLEHSVGPACYKGSTILLSKISIKNIAKFLDSII